MINSFKKYLNSWMENRLSKLGKRQRSLNLKNFHFLQLSSLFNDTPNFIPLTVYSISPSTIVHILNDISINNRKSIIEFGSGASTLFIVKFLKLYNNETQFLSVESNKDWYEKMKTQIRLLGLDNNVNLIYAPLKPLPQDLVSNKVKFWYSTAELTGCIQKINVFDLILIDGPDGDLSPYIRSSAIPFLKDVLASSYTIFLDDANRKEEKEMASEWQIKLNCELKFIDHYACLIKKSKFLSNPYSLG